MPITIHNHWIDKLAFIAGVASGLALYPQVWLIVNTHTLEGVSIATYAIIFINSIVWLAYSMHRGLLSLGITSILNIVASGLVILYALSVGIGF